eukprot:TRINITY_DN61739_c0_g1_i1.p1 TRINITY_DN61739_c0_g1~~TRINITY_DN61739_c0_g1_i1.p1  ORF type:complete len:1134 (-),score=333.61 TRINITY_DN61739_c0_g1_i1:38-3439(-)
MYYQRELLQVGDAGSPHGARKAPRGMARAWSDSQVPVLPAVGGRGSPSGAGSPMAGMLPPVSSSAVRLPMLPGAGHERMQRMQRLEEAASAASGSAAAAAAEVSERLKDGKRSRAQNRRKQKARENILQLISLHPVGPNNQEAVRKQQAAGEALEQQWKESDIRRQWEWESYSLPPAPLRKLSQDEQEILPLPPKPVRAPPKPKGADTLQEWNSLNVIKQTAQQICSELQSKRKRFGDLDSRNGPNGYPGEAPPGKLNAQGVKTLGRQANKKWDSQAKAQHRATAEAEMDAWRKATLAAVPEADDATKSEAEQRKRQQDELRQKEAETTRDEASLLGPDGSDAEKRPNEDSEKKSEEQAAASASGKSTKAKPVPIDPAEDESYGLNDLTARLKEMESVLFGTGELMDEKNVARLKTVFLRFQTPGEHEIPKDDLPDIIRFYGMVVISEADVKALADEVVRDYNVLDFTDFLTFFERFMVQHEARMKDTFYTFDFNGNGTMEVFELRKLLLNLGFVVVRQMIEEALAVADLDSDGRLTFQEFIRFLIVYTHREGFTIDEVRNIWNVYDGFVSETIKLGKGKGLLCRDAGDALVAVFGLHCEPYAVRLCNYLLQNSLGQKRNEDVNNGLTFAEFLKLSRGLRELEQVEYKKVFREFDKDGSGKICTRELRDVLFCLGYKFMRPVINEVLEEVDYESDRMLDFEEFYHYMCVFRKRDGFTKKELEQYKLVFEKHDEDMSDSINVHELGEMLRYLGLNAGTDDLHLLVAEVDVNRNGSLDVMEFLRLMRLHREGELKRLAEIFERFAAKDQMPKQLIFNAVQASLSEDASEDHVKHAIQGATSRTFDFEDFVEMADKARWSKVLSERKMAGFTEEEIKSLEVMFSHYDKDGSGDIDSQEVEDLLRDFGLPLRTKEERQMVLSKLDFSKQLAQEAGVERDKEKANTMICFWELVQLVRLIKTDRAKMKEERNRELIDQLRFSKLEVDDFRTIFLSWARHGGMQPASQSSKLGRQSLASQTSSEAGDKKEIKVVSLNEDDDDASLGLPMFQKLLKSLGMTITSMHKQTLEMKTDGGPRSVDTDKGNLSFVGFLQMMRWMLDTDFASINNISAKVAANVQAEYFAKERSQKGDSTKDKTS